MGQLSHQQPAQDQRQRFGGGFCGWHAQRLLPRLASTSSRVTFAKALTQAGALVLVLVWTAGPPWSLTPTSSCHSVVTPVALSRPPVAAPGGPSPRAVASPGFPSVVSAVAAPSHRVFAGTPASSSHSVSAARARPSVWSRLAAAEPDSSPCSLALARHSLASSRTAHVGSRKDGQGPSRDPEQLMSPISFTRDTTGPSPQAEEVKFIRFRSDSHGRSCINNGSRAMILRNVLVRHDES